MPALPATPTPRSKNRDWNAVRTDWNSFALPPGAYATGVFEALGEVAEAPRGGVAPAAGGGDEDEDEGEGEDAR